MDDHKTEDERDAQAALTLLRALWVYMSEDNAGVLRLHAKLDGILVGKHTQAYFSYTRLAEKGLLTGQPPIPLPVEGSCYDPDERRPANYYEQFNK